MKIPDIRQRLYQKATQHSDPEIAALADELQRRPSQRRADRVSTPATPEVRQAIREHLAEHPKATNHEVAAVFGVNPGRVSEERSGFRE